jgi:hypothetical protein
MTRELQTCRHVGDIAMLLWLVQDDIGRHLFRRASFALALQMSCCEICWHMTKIDFQSRCWRHVGCCPKQGDREWWEDMPANMSPTFPTKASFSLLSNHRPLYFLPALHICKSSLQSIIVSLHPSYRLLSHMLTKLKKLRTWTVEQIVEMPNAPLHDIVCPLVTD